jgi:hypothetical protein
VGLAGAQRAHRGRQRNRSGEPEVGPL